MTGEEKYLPTWPGWGSNPDLPGGSQTVYRATIKAGLYSKVVQVYIYLYPVTFSPTKLGFVPEDPGHRECWNNRHGELLHGAIGWFYFGRQMWQVKKNIVAWPGLKPRVCRLPFEHSNRWATEPCDQPVTISPCFSPTLATKCYRQGKTTWPDRTRTQGLSPTVQAL